MSTITDPTILDAIENLMVRVREYKETKDIESLLSTLQYRNGQYIEPLQAHYVNNPETPKHEHFSFELSEEDYLTYEQYFLTPEEEPEEPIEGEEPEWAMDSSELGTFEFEDDIYIPLEFSDPDMVVTGIRVEGTLPTGIEVNEMDFSLYGYVDDENSASYEFTLFLTTDTGQEYPYTFTFNVLNTESYVEWVTPAHIGTFGIGHVINRPLVAERRFRSV